MSSFGSLKHFTKANKPEEAGTATRRACCPRPCQALAFRCMSCAFEPRCAYSAKKIYLDPLVTQASPRSWLCWHQLCILRAVIALQGHKGWPVSIITDVPDVESVTAALNNGPYGRCAYECDNDVCDNQALHCTCTMLRTLLSVCSPNRL